MNRSFKIIPQIWLILCLFIFSEIFPKLAFSDDIRISASVDKTQLTLEDSIELAVTIHGLRKIPKIELPPLPDFKVRSAGTQSSTQIFNSNMRVSTTHKYLLIPQNIGRFTIGSVILNLSGTIYKTDPIIIIVNKPNHGKPNKNKNVFVEASVSNKEPFVGEQIVYTFKFYRRMEARNLKLNMPYDESFFRKEDIGQTKRYSKVINGISYNVEEVSMALFPLKVGEAIIPPSTLELDLIYKTQQNLTNDPFARFFNDPFLRGSTKTFHKVLTTKQINLKIHRLPEKGKPKTNNGLVGRFSILAKLGKTSIEVGDTTTLTVIVSGTGNISDVTLSENILKEQFKVYPDQPDFKQSIHGNRIGGEKIFKFALVPYSIGKKTIPSISLNYFDPDKKNYNTVSTNPITLAVKPGQNEKSLNINQPQSLLSPQNAPPVSILARDIFPIHTQLKDFGNSTFNSSRKAIYIALIIFPVILYFITAGYIRFNHRMRNDSSYFRRQEAYNLAIKKLDKLSSSQIKSKYSMQELSQIIREYIGNKLNLQGTAFTSTEIEKLLTRVDFDKEKISVVKNFLEKCESMQYMPAQVYLNREIIDESISLLNKLEKQRW